MSSRFRYIIHRKLLCGILSKTGDVVLPLEYDQIGVPYKGYFIIKKEGKFGVMDHNFTLVIPCVYDSIEPWTDSYFKVRIHGEGIGIISVNNEIVVQCEYDKIGAVLEGTVFFVVTKNGTEGLMDVSFHLVVQCEYYSIIPLGSGLLKVSKPLQSTDIKYLRSIGVSPKLKYGVISSNGEELIPVDYDDIQETNQEFGRFIVKKNNKKGIIDSQFKIIIPCEYDDIAPWGNSLFVVSVYSEMAQVNPIYEGQVKYYYIINQNNERISHHNFLEIPDLENDRACSYTVDYKTIVLDANGCELDVIQL